MMYVILKGMHEVRNGAVLPKISDQRVIGTIEFAGNLHLIKPSGCVRLWLPPGRYEVERSPNPYGFEAPWLVLRGTLIGMAEGAWRQWEGAEWGEMEIVIEEGEG